MVEGQSGTVSGHGAPSIHTPEYDRRGLLLGAGAYSMWILFPIYFRSLAAVSPLGILATRIVMSLLFMAIVITWTHMELRPFAVDCAFACAHLWLLRPAQKASPAACRHGAYA